jgi:tripartite-type tricarboxylate transporter receptor subunit TctC
VDKIQKEMARALHMPDVQASLVKIGVSAVGSTPEEFGALLKSEVPRWAEVARRSGVVPQ